MLSITYILCLLSISVTAYLFVINLPKVDFKKLDLRVRNKKKNLSKIKMQFPNMLSLLSNALKAGLSLPQAIEMASVEIDDPLGGEMKQVVAQLKLGMSVEDALSMFKRQVPLDDVMLMVHSVETLRKTGGNLVETFNSLGVTIERRRRVEERVSVLTSQGIYQGIVLLAMPWALGFAIGILAPNYLQPLFTTRIGFMFICIGVFLEVAGALWLKTIVKIKV